MSKLNTGRNNTFGRREDLYLTLLFRTVYLLLIQTCSKMVEPTF